MPTFWITASRVNVAVLISLSKRCGQATGTEYSSSAKQTRRESYERNALFRHGVYVLFGPVASTPPSHPAICAFVGYARGLGARQILSWLATAQSYSVSIDLLTADLRSTLQVWFSSCGGHTSHCFLD